MTARAIADPEKFLRQPAWIQKRLERGVVRPIGGYWLRKRLDGLQTKMDVTITRADVVGDRLSIHLNDGSTLDAAAAVLATGYKIDVTKYDILDQSIRQTLQLRDGYPLMSKGLETSIPGLFMVGVVGEKTLGPTLRFVTGTSNAGPRVAGGVVDRLRSAS